jgi:hypothetical protein
MAATASPALEQTFGMARPVSSVYALTAILAGIPVSREF